jgi:hypothetical protein
MQYFKISFFIFLLTTGIGCFHKNANDLSTDRALNSNIEASNLTIQSQTRSVYAALAARLSDPAIKFKAGVWNPKAEQVRKVSEDCYIFLESIKDALKASFGIDNNGKGNNVNEAFSKSTTAFFNSGEKKKILIRNLKKYEADLLSIDTEMAKTFEHTFFRHTNMESSDTDTSALIFKDLSVSKALLLLNMIQNNVRINESMLAMFCLNKIPSGGCGYSLGPFFITSQNSSYIKPGDHFEITAGMGAFTIQGRPKILVNGKNVDLNPEGVAVLKIKAASRPGKYYVPVSIQYTDVNGMENMKERTLEYTVADTVKMK